MKETRLGMRVLLSDFIIVEAHKPMIIDYIDIFSKISELSIISVNGYYENERKRFEELGIKILDIKCKKKIGKINQRIFSYQLMKLTGKIIESGCYDINICLGYETISFAFGRRFIKQIPISIFHHKNIDELTSIYKRILFNIYKNKVFHFVYEQFFGEHLSQDLNVKKQRIFTIPHPVKRIDTNKDEKIVFDCVGLCNSNSEIFIKQCLDNEKLFAEKNYTIVLRSKEKAIKVNNISIIKGFMEYEKYCKYLDRAKTVLIPLPDNYIYRLSGSIYDALARKKIVLTNSRFYVEAYGKRYPGLCYYVESIKDLLSFLDNLNDAKDKSNIFEDFINEHSKDKIGNTIIMAIKTIYNKEKGNI